MRTFKRFLTDRSGNFGMLAGILAVPLFASAALLIDYGRALKTKNEVQLAEDASVLAGVKATRDAIAEGKPLSQAKQIGKDVALRIFRENSRNNSEILPGAFSATITVQNGVITGNGVYDPAAIDATFARILGFIELPIYVESQAMLSLGKFTEIHLVVDVSASMGVGADTSDINILASTINCAFACHTPPGMTTWTTTTDTGRNAGARLRIDIVKQALTELTQTLQDKGANVKISLHTFSNRLMTDLDLSDDFDDTLATIANLDITNKWQQGGTSFSEVLHQAKNVIGPGGTGNSANDPKKVVLFFTDGVATNVRYAQGVPLESEADPLFVPFNGGVGAWSLHGFNPNDCKPLRNNNVEVHSIYTEYVIPTVGTDDDSRFETIEKTLKGQIEDSLESCASDPSKFYHTRAPQEILDAVAKIADEIAETSLRLTN